MQYPILLISSSAVHGYGYLECNKDAILELTKDIKTPVLFVPYAAGGQVSARAAAHVLHFA